MIDGSKGGIMRERENKPTQKSPPAGGRGEKLTEALTATKRRRPDDRGGGATERREPVAKRAPPIYPGGENVAEVRKSGGA